MVVIFSKILAIILTVILACALYPIAAIFYVIGLFGMIGDTLFKWTNNVIKKLWGDLKNEKILKDDTQ